MTAFLAPVGLLVSLALAGGGFDVTTRHIAGLVVWLLIVALLVLGAASKAALGRPFYWVLGLMGAIGLLSAISSLWSGSVQLSLVEANRVLVYLGIFLATFLIVQTDERRQRFAEGITSALVFVALLGLASRLLPHVLDVGSLGDGPRLLYPLGYWNADGVVFGITAAMLLWTSRRGMRGWLSVAAMPAVLLALYFTYSRGGLLALVIATGITIVLSQDRLWMLATLAVGALGALPAVLAVQERQGLADNLPGQATIDQGVTVLLILLAGTALSLVLFAGLRWVENRESGVAGRAVELSRNPTVLNALAAVGILLTVAAVAAVGGRAWDRFSDSDLQFPERPEAHFSDLSGAGRHDFWRVAIDAFEEDPILGVGAGTYEFAWERNRSIELPLHDAHSLYLESFAELGLIGGLLVLGLVGGILWSAFSAWRATRHPQQELYAAMLAAILAFAVAAGLDWFWEITFVGAVFFLCAGVVVAARCAKERPNVMPREGEEGRRWRLAMGGLALAWISAIALVAPLLAERELDASRSAAGDADIAAALDHAERARSIEPWAASPYVQLGLLAQLQREYGAAISHFTDAIEREDQNWQWYYLRSKVEQEAGEESAAQKDLERARQLNPLAACLRIGPNCG